jgi:hypothetical protein
MHLVQSFFLVSRIVCPDHAAGGAVARCASWANWAGRIGRQQALKVAVERAATWHLGARVVALLDQLVPDPLVQLAWYQVRQLAVALERGHGLFDLAEAHDVFLQGLISWPA